MLMQKEFLWFLFHTHRDVFSVLANLAGCLCLYLLRLPAAPAAEHWLQKSLPSMGQSSTMDLGTERHPLCAGLVVLPQVDSCKCSSDSERDDIWLWRHAVLGLRFSNSGAVVDN